MSDTTELNIAQRLREWCNTVRRKPCPIADAIPMVQDAADALEQQAHAAKVADDLAEARERIIAKQKSVIEQQAAQIAEKSALIDVLRAEIYRLTEGVQSIAKADHE